jgi:hypothetical protein
MWSLRLGWRKERVEKYINLYKDFQQEEARHASNNKQVRPVCVEMKNN